MSEEHRLGDLGRRVLGKGEPGRRVMGLRPGEHGRRKMEFGSGDLYGRVRVPRHGARESGQGGWGPGSPADRSVAVVRGAQQTSQGTRARGARSIGARKTGNGAGFRGARQTGL